MTTYTNKQETTFYEEIQNCKGLDLRDRRGKVHDSAILTLDFFKQNQLLDALAHGFSLKIIGL